MDSNIYLAKFVEWFIGVANVPNAILAFLIVLSAWILRTAQKDTRFEIGLMLTDEHGKPSSSRFAVLISLGITSYLLAYVFIHRSVEDPILLNMFYAYIVTWAASKSVEKIIDAWAGKRNSANEAGHPELGLKKTVDTISTSTETITKT